MIRSAVLQGLRVPLWIAGAVIFLTAFLLLPILTGYSAMAFNAASNAAGFLHLMAPASVWQWLFHHSVWTDFSIIIGMQMICKVVESTEHNEAQTSWLCRFACALSAAFCGTLLLRITGDISTAMHLHPDLMRLLGSLPLRHNNLIAREREDVFVIAVCCYGLGWAFAPAVSTAREKRVIRGAEPASYDALRNATREPNRGEPPYPTMK